jgi:hypothetical protein
MIKLNKILIAGSFVTAITIIWFVISVYLTLLLAAANDTLGQGPPAPLWFTVLCTIALFPLSLFGDFQIPFVSDRTAAHIDFLLMFINSVLWGLLWYFLFRNVARFFTKNSPKGA